MGQQFEEDSKTVENEGLSLLRLSEVRSQSSPSRTSVQQALICIASQVVICKGWFLHPNTYDCGSFVEN